MLQISILYTTDYCSYKSKKKSSALKNRSSIPIKDKSSFGITSKETDSKQDCLCQAKHLHCTLSTYLLLKLSF